MPRRLTLALVAAVLLSAVLLGACADTGPASSSLLEAGRVARISDGDTLRLADGRRIRLVQIDAPERDFECFGNAATNALTVLAPVGSMIELERDPSLDDRDRNGRLLRYVRAGGRHVNVELVRLGAAAPYFYRGERGRHAAALLRAAKLALAERRGLWRACPAARLAPTRQIATGPP
jgi:endonuclease YncB( thermonuclease family)